MNWEGLLSYLVRQGLPCQTLSTCAADGPIAAAKHVARLLRSPDSLRPHQRDTLAAYLSLTCRIHDIRPEDLAS